jgi:hypothetical protein
MYEVNAMDENTAKKLILSILVVVIFLEIGALLAASSGINRYSPMWRQERLTPASYT